jgi:hypothetical protein
MSIEGCQFPITQNIACAFGNFRAKFCACDNNYKYAHLLNNHCLTIGVRSKDFLTDELIDTEADLNINLTRTLRNIRISDLIIDGQKISKAVFCRTIGEEISAAFWQKLDKIRNTALLRYGSDDYLPVKTIENFMSEWKKGSKKIRTVLTKTRIENIPHNIVKYAENTETVIGIDTLKYLNSFWNRSYFSNNFRVFLFKLYNNTLPYNTILSHFVRDIGRNCTFCDI